MQAVLKSSILANLINSLWSIIPSTGMWPKPQSLTICYWIDYILGLPLENLAIRANWSGASDLCNSIAEKKKKRAGFEFFV